MATIIGWTNETWNPTTGCSKVSEGCRFCYAEALSLRFGWSEAAWTHPNAARNVKTHPERLRKPYTWKKPSRVFVNSMSDLFHELIPDSFIAEVFAVMNDLPQHTFQVLTKRPERAAQWAGPWTPNIWMGTSVEDARVAHRIDSLRVCAAQTRFLSCEPLIGSLGPVDLSGIHWVIAGGESGRHLARPEFKHRLLDMQWARELRNRCVAQDAAFFFKQDSGLRTELRPWLVEEDGSCWAWQQYPGHMIAPYPVDPETASATEVRLTTQNVTLPMIAQPSLAIAAQ